MSTAPDVSTLFAALGGDTRREIFELVADRPRSVSELAARMPVSQPAVSQHLQALREAGLVEARAEGRRRIYSVRSDGLLALRAWVDRFWSEALEAYARSFDDDEEGS